VSALAKGWLEAAKDLDLRVRAPFVLDTKAGARAEFDVLVQDFGGKNGMVLMQQWDSAKAEIAKAAGFGFSCMDGGPYDRESTIEALKDWGWCGSGPAPSWLRAAT
jgi:hypothetical protein